MKKTIASIISLVTLTTSALAWQPTRPVEVHIGHGPGSANELVFRALSAEVEKNTGAKFVIINQVGAGGAIATRNLAAKAADGHSIGMMTSIGIPVTDQMFIPNAATRGYGIDDFTYLMLPAFNQFAIIANPKDTVNTPADLVKALNTEPVTFIAGGGARLVYEVLRNRTSFKDVVHLNDNGPVHAVTEIIGGHSRFAVVPSLIATTFHNAGKIKIIATTGPKRIKYLPNIPVVGEALPGYDVNTGWGIVAPKGLPKDVQAWYVREFNRALQSESVKTFYATNIVELPDASEQTPEGFRKYVVDHQAKYAKIVEQYVKELPQKK
jgi:tripartite-type tricarboxylate transporter receptor subunit TctC